ncbi:TPA: acetyl-CoA carboxylase carboxyl transferase subunit beta [bacterium]|nr:acetyl-CoA carboxylase carboxyl transferase subunit beta [bacterium]
MVQDKEGVLPPQNRRTASDGLWIKCEKCQELVYRREWERLLQVCPHCRYYSQLTAKERIAFLLDKASFKEHDKDLKPTDPLGFKDSKTYKKRLAQAQKKTGLFDATITGEGQLGGHKVAIGALDFGFMGGSMGTVVGEKITRIIEKATKRRLPLILVSSSGGARMQEGVFSLMQMVKTSSAIAWFKEKGGLYISILTHPTTGGVTASFASLGDIIIAEPKTLIGFAGPRVIEKTIKESLPEGFQRAEFLLKHGLIDMIVERHHLRKVLIQILDFFKSEKCPL